MLSRPLRKEREPVVAYPAADRARTMNARESTKAKAPWRIGRVKTKKETSLPRIGSAIPQLEAFRKKRVRRPVPRGSDAPNQRAMKPAMRYTPQDR